MFHRFFAMFKFNDKVNTSVTTAGRSWPNYIGPKREKHPSLSNQPSVCSFTLKVAWSGSPLLELLHAQFKSIVLPQTYSTVFAFYPAYTASVDNESK